MIVGGGIVYCLLASSSSSSSSAKQLITGNGVEQAAAAAAAAAATAGNTTAAAAAAPAVPSSFNPQEAPAEPPLCEDTCFKAKDGVCDDGRFVANMTRGLASRVLCDLGTDCSDCGIWKGKQHSAAWSEPVGPIEYLRRANLSVLARRSAMEPLVYYFAVTDPAHDIDLSTHFANLGSVEPQISHIAYHVLHAPCQKGSSSSSSSSSSSGGVGQQGGTAAAAAAGGLMLDVGANFGWYSIMAAMLGCRVIAWEPVTTFRAFLEYNIARNKLHHRIEVRRSAVVQHPSLPGAANYSVVSPQRGNWGTASVNGSNIDTSVDNQGPYHKLNVTGVTLDQELQQLLQQQQQQRVALLKLDVEGYEPQVLAGASQLLQKQLVDNILLEYSPHIVERTDISNLATMPRMLLSLLVAGFKLGHIARRDFGGREVASLSEPLEMLPSVTATNLKFDLFDCLQMTEQGLMWLRQPCREMTSHNLILDGVPERLHPKSFRSAFEINTNVWASREPRFTPYLEGPAVGAFPAERKLTDSWFIPEWSDAAMGGRSCKNLQQVAADEAMPPPARASLLVSHRCRCGSQKPCEKEEKLADACAQSGRTPFSDDPDFVPDR
uniref:Methyltransferase FkbM domain-containing protein n=1 Tax=Tetradesmus obliquus TaxID=3088 RepID=A0A383VNT6_TETOB|eukprot:jgi/Sobl393_1/10774/SZX67185.1